MIIFVVLVLVVALWGSGEAGERSWTTEHPNGSLERCRVWDDRELGLQMECKVTPKEFQCEQKMREAMTKLREVWRSDENSRSFRRGFVMTDEIWLRDFEPIYQECVR